MPLINKQRLMGSGQVTSASAQNEGTFHPKQVSGLQQWYDASDASTLVTASAVTSQTFSIITSPLSIPSCSLWLDADDASSMTVASGTVSEWRNKSVDDTGLFDHAQSNASYQPAYITGAINSRTVVRFDGSNDELRGSGSTSRRSPAGSDQTFTYFLVARTTNTAGIETLLQWGLNSGYNYSGTYTTWAILNAQGYSGKYMLFGNANSAYEIATDAAGAMTTTARIFTVTQTTSNQTYHVTGTLNASTSTPWTNVYPSNNGYIYSMIGDDAYGAGARSFEGDIAEIIVYNRDLSTSEREQVETYLDDKWGVTVATQSYGSTDVTSSFLTQWQDKSGNAFHLTASSTTSAPVLSANEIYTHAAVQFSGTVSSSLPVVTSSTTVYGNNWYPTSIASCSLWLDADDASSITLDGSTVLKWTNKSTDHTGIFDYHQSASSYQPEYVSSVINGKSVVRFDGSDDLLYGSGSSSQRSPANQNSELTFFIVIRNYPSLQTNYRTVFGWGMDSGYNQVNEKGFRPMFDFNNQSAGYDLTFQSKNTNHGYIASHEGLTTDARIYTAINDNPGQYYVNGVSRWQESGGVPITSSYPPADTYLWSRIGEDGANLSGRHFAGDIAEIICYSRDLTTPEREQVETYLADKWGITLP